MTIEATKELLDDMERVAAVLLKNQKNAKGKDGNSGQAWSNRMLSYRITTWVTAIKKMTV